MAGLWLDTSVFTVALQNHRDSDACRSLLREIEAGRVQAVLDPVVLCEIAYMLVKPIFVPPDRPPRSPRHVSEHLLSVVNWPGLEARERDSVIVALECWREGQCDDLVDAYLQARAAAEGEQVCTVNLRHIPDGVHPSEALGGPALPRRPVRRPRKR